MSRTCYVPGRYFLTFLLLFAQFGGAAIYNAGTLTVTLVNFTRNQANPGGYVRVEALARESCRADLLYSWPGARAVCLGTRTNCTASAMRPRRARNTSAMLPQRRPDP